MALFFLISCALASLVLSAPTMLPFPYPALDDDIIPWESSTPFFIFDGFNYDEFPTELKKKHYNCYGEHMRCIRNRTYLHYICVLLKNDKYGHYYSMCQLELENCKDRVYYGTSVFGHDYTDDKHFYQGEGANCEYSQEPREQEIRRRLKKRQPHSIKL